MPRAKRGEDLTRFAAAEEAKADEGVFRDQSWRAVSQVPAEWQKRWWVDRYRSQIADARIEFRLTFELEDEPGQPFFLIFRKTVRPESKR
jgi:hypothetical protein